MIEPVLPDRESLLVQALRARSEITALAATRVGTRLAATFPCVRVTLLGGSPRPTTGTGRPTFQVECWGNGTDTTAEVQASQLAGAVEAVAGDLAGSYSAGKIIGSWCAGEPFNSPDPTTSRARYLLMIGLVIQP